MMYSGEVMEAIRVALKTEFGAACEIYMEEKEQDLKESCFFIQCLESSRELFLGNRYLERNQFCIQYFPKSGVDQNREFHEITERLHEYLEYIHADKPMRGTKMKSQMVDGVLNFFVDYNYFVYRQEENLMMEGMEPHIAVKGGD